MEIKLYCENSRCRYQEDGECTSSENIIIDEDGICDIWKAQDKLYRKEKK